MKKIEEFLSAAVDSNAPATDVVDGALETMRTYLGMDIAYLSEFVDDQMVIRAIQAPGFEATGYPGAAFPNDYVYCHRISQGTLPNLIPDTSAHEGTREMPITRDFPIGSIVSVPIHRRDGSIYGMFCCVSTRPNPSLNQRDLRMMHAFAELSAHQVNETVQARLRAQQIEERIDAAMSEHSFHMVYQPIVGLETLDVTGYEALCRFASEPYRTPDVWFDEADELGRKIDLEVHVARSALPALARLPRDVYLSVNASPETIMSGRLCALFRDLPRERLVVELTEHTRITDYEALEQGLSSLRLGGVRLAIDDAGAGYSGLFQIARLRPDILKLDRSLTADIDQNQAQRSICAAMLYYAQETDAVVVAEGIETEAELQTLRRLGVHKGQGFLLGRPQRLEEVLSGAANLPHPVQGKP